MVASKGRRRNYGAGIYLSTGALASSEHVIARHVVRTPTDVEELCCSGHHVYSLSLSNDSVICTYEVDFPFVASTLLRRNHITEPINLNSASVGETCDKLKSWQVSQQSNLVTDHNSMLLVHCMSQNSLYALTTLACEEEQNDDSAEAASSYVLNFRDPPYPRWQQG